MDKGTPPLSSTTEVIVLLKDINDKKREFRFPSPGKKTILISEPIRLDTIIGEIKAEDPVPDSHDPRKIVFKIRSPPNQNLFKIEENSGKIGILRPFISDDVKEHVLVIEVNDNWQPSLQSTATLNIIIQYTAIINGTQENNYPFDKTPSDNYSFKRKS